MNLKVPFSEKDAAKKLGARWDAGRKVWYIENGDTSAFGKWSPTPDQAIASAGSIQGAAVESSRKLSGKLIIGAAYVPLLRICDCLPWEICEKCQLTAK